MALSASSSLNIFFSPDGESVLVSTSTHDIPGFIIPGQKYPIRRTSKYYSVKKCEHSYVFFKDVQLRRADEVSSTIVKCTKCGDERIANK